MCFYLFELEKETQICAARFDSSCKGRTAFCLTVLLIWLLELMIHDTSPTMHPHTHLANKSRPGFTISVQLFLFTTIMFNLWLLPETHLSQMHAHASVLEDKCVAWLWKELKDHMIRLNKVVVLGVTSEDVCVAALNEQKGSKDVSCKLMFTEAGHHSDKNRLTLISPQFYVSVLHSCDRLFIHSLETKHPNQLLWFVWINPEIKNISRKVPQT